MYARTYIKCMYARAYIFCESTSTLTSMPCVQVASSQSGALGVLAQCYALASTYGDAYGVLHDNGVDALSGVPI